MNKQCFIALLASETELNRASLYSLRTTPAMWNDQCE